MKDTYGVKCEHIKMRQMEKQIKVKSLEGFLVKKKKEIMIQRHANLMPEQKMLWLNRKVAEMVLKSWQTVHKHKQS